MREISILQILITFTCIYGAIDDLYQKNAFSKFSMRYIRLSTVLHAHLLLEGLHCCQCLLTPFCSLQRLLVDVRVARVKRRDPLLQLGETLRGAVLSYGESFFVEVSARPLSL